MKAISKVVLFLGLLGLVVTPVASALDASEEPAKEAEPGVDGNERSNSLEGKEEPDSDEAGQSDEKQDDHPDIHISLIECQCSTDRLRTTGKACSCERLLREAVKNVSRPQQGVLGGPVPQRPERNLPLPRGPSGLAEHRGIPAKRRLRSGFGWGGGYYPGYGYGGYSGYGWGYPGYYGYGYGYPGYGYGGYYY